MVEWDLVVFKLDPDNSKNFERPDENNNPFGYYPGESNR